MNDIFEINTRLNQILETSSYPDDSRNGLQVESSQIEVKKVALAVDAGLSVIEKAIQANANLLIVHHGLFWGQEQIITGSFAKKIDLLLSNGCSLIAQHLPLDGNPQLGNNYELARLFKLEKLSGFSAHGQDKFIGVKGNLANPVDTNYFIELAKQLDGFDYQLNLNFGPKEISSCAIVSGGGSFCLSQAKLEGIDLFISGEAKQSSFHEAKDNQQNALFLGHYATETVGVKAVGKYLEKEFSVETFFISEPTGI